MKKPETGLPVSRTTRRRKPRTVGADITTWLPELCRQAEEVPEPGSLFAGADTGVTVSVRNVVVFLRRSRRSLQRRSFASRSHHRHVFMVVLDTPGVVSLDGASYRVEPGQAILVLPFQFHHYLDLESDHLRWLFITFECLEEESPLAALGNQVIPLSQDLAQYIKSLLGYWMVPAAERNALMIQATLGMILSQLLSLDKKPWAKPGGMTGGESSWAFAAEREIQRAALEGRTLEDAARRLGMSERRLRSRFEEAIGVGIRPYRANFILHRAVALMRDSRLSLGEIAGLTGFQTPQAFHRFVRRECGLTPREYRRSLFNRDSAKPTKPPWEDAGRRPRGRR